MRLQRNQACWRSLMSKTDWPSKSTRPSVGTSSAPIWLKKVDLPEPDGPMIEMNSPRRMSRSMPLSAQSTSSPVT